MHKIVHKRSHVEAAAGHGPPSGTKARISLPSTSLPTRSSVSRQMLALPGAARPGLGRACTSQFSSHAMAMMTSFLQQPGTLGTGMIQIMSPRPSRSSSRQHSIVAGDVDQCKSRLECVPNRQPCLLRKASGKA